MVRTYYQKLKQMENKRLSEEKQKRKAEEHTRKAEEKSKKREQIAAMKRMKQIGIAEKRKKEFVETRERRLKKLGIKIKKEKKNGGWIFHLDKSRYKRKEGLFKKREPIIRYKTTKKSSKRKKKKGFWKSLMSL
jgi:hypothetical protein